MASLNSLWLKTETIRTLLETLEKKGDKGVEFTITINDEANQYNQNVGAYVSQTKEQREQKKPRFYVGNGKTFWTDGKITAIRNEPQAAQAEEVPAATEKDDLPF